MRSSLWALRLLSHWLCHASHLGLCHKATLQAPDSERGFTHKPLLLPSAHRHKRRKSSRHQSRKPWECSTKRASFTVIYRLASQTQCAISSDGGAVDCEMQPQRQRRVKSRWKKNVSTVNLKWMLCRQLLGDNFELLFFFSWFQVVPGLTLSTSLDIHYRGAEKKMKLTIHCFFCIYNWLNGNPQ